MYLTKELVTLNYGAGYAHSGGQLLNSSTFSNYVHDYLDYLKADSEALYFYALNSKTTREATFEILKLFRMPRIFRAEEMDPPYLDDKAKPLEFVKEMYSFWKKHQRFSMMSIGQGNALQDLIFVGADSSFISPILELYRNIEE